MSDDEPESANIEDCVLCDCYHALQFCPKFLAMSLKRRQKVIIRYELCFNCLARSHTPARCTVFETCERCGGLHHSLLHNPVPIQLSKASMRRHRPSLMPRPGTRPRSRAASRDREQRRMRHERNVRSGPIRLYPIRKRRISKLRSLFLALNLI